MQIKVRYQNEAAKPIQQAHAGEWFDLRCAEDVRMKRGEFKVLSLGVSIELPKGYEAIVAPRSSTFSKHGIILAKSNEAKKLGIYTGETIWQALQKCPELILVPPDMKAYHHYSAKVHQIYRRFTDIIEPFGIDEAWLDVT